MINVVLATDNNYLQHTCVTLVSLFSNTNPSDLTINLLYNDLNEIELETIRKCVNQNNSNIVFYLIDTSRLKGFLISNHISLGAYFRLLVGDVLPIELEKVIYLDSDLVILDDIKKLYNSFDFEETLGAVPQPMSKEHKRFIAINPNSTYFNSGVLLINLKKWRELNIFNKALNLIESREAGFPYWDQDILNILFENKYQTINLRWNMIYSYCTLYKRHFKRVKFGIIHYTGSKKPWDAKSYHPYKRLYWKYFKETPLSKGKHRKIKAAQIAYEAGKFLQIKLKLDMLKLAMSGNLDKEFDFKKFTNKNIDL